MAGRPNPPPPDYAPPNFSWAQIAGSPAPPRAPGGAAAAQRAPSAAAAAAAQRTPSAAACPVAGVGAGAGAAAAQCTPSLAASAGAGTGAGVAFPGAGAAFPDGGRERHHSSGHERGGRRVPWRRRRRPTVRGLPGLAARHAGTPPAAIVGPPVLPPPSSSSWAQVAGPFPPPPPHVRPPWLLPSWRGRRPPWAWAWAWEPPPCAPPLLHALRACTLPPQRPHSPLPQPSLPGLPSTAGRPPSPRRHRRLCRRTQRLYACGPCPPCLEELRLLPRRPTPSAPPPTLRPQLLLPRGCDQSVLTGSLTRAPPSTPRPMRVYSLLSVLPTLPVPLPSWSPMAPAFLSPP